MLIAVDGNEANVKKRVGSNVYAYELLNQFHVQPRHRFLVYLKSPALVDMPQPRPRFQYRVVGPKKLWTKIGLPLALFCRQPRPNVFFTPSHYTPLFSPCPRVMSIMDMSYIHYPAMFKKSDLIQLRRWTAQSVWGAAKILTISQFSKNAIIKHYQVDPKRVIVTYPGMRVKQTISLTKAKQILKQYGLSADYLLYVGTLQPRKNLIRLIEAFGRLKVGPRQLVIVGKKGWLYDEIFSKVKELGLTSRVIFTGFVPDEELPAFYQSAACFVLVSLYEGFGLPILEAMQYGCPVVASNVSSLPEVVGNAGILVDPENVADIAAGIKKAIKNRKSLIAKGRQQVKKFSWEKCARQTLEVLENVATKR